MAEPLTDIVASRLAVLKELFLFALQHSTGTRSVQRRIVSVIAFDLAVENALRLTILSLDPSFKLDTDTTHPKLVQRTTDALSSHGYHALPYLSGLGYLHHVRNDAQHNGRYPSEDELAECRAHARAFLTSLVALVWGVEFEAISLAALVRDTDASALLGESEGALRRGEATAAVNAANAALSWLISIAAKEFFPNSANRLWQGMGPIRWNIGLGQPQKPKLDPPVVKEFERIRKDHSYDLHDVQQKLGALREQVKDEFDVMEEPLLCSLLNLSYAQYLEFRRIAGRIRFNAGPRDFVVAGGKTPISTEEAEFVHAFCIDSALQVEAHALWNEPRPDAQSGSPGEA